ncbi:hypothetical protein CJ030_MR3G007093 [Morella rubra]|uniref:Uncharacterized protein n=1 Tax=Morella rubra TaxID=262757 RepID=A0A6A1W4A3_9ROSI|nr:hypothetical protein CJ030_MR3G007093 [Morella rubra]
MSFSCNFHVELKEFQVLINSKGVIKLAEGSVKSMSVIQMGSRKVSTAAVSGVQNGLSFAKVVKSGMPEVVAGNRNSNGDSGIDDSRRTLKGKEMYKGRHADSVAIIVSEPAGWCEGDTGVWVLMKAQQASVQQSKEVGCEVLNDMGAQFRGIDRMDALNGLETHLGCGSNDLSLNTSAKAGLKLDFVKLRAPVASSSHQGVGFVDLGMLEVGVESLKGMLVGIEGVNDHSVGIMAAGTVNDVEGSALVCGEDGDPEMEVEPLAVCLLDEELGAHLSSVGMSGFWRWCLHFDTW